MRPGWLWAAAARLSMPAQDGRLRQEYPDSYHYLEACQIVADLLVADGRFDKAESYYGELAKAPWEDTKMRAAIGTGRALLAQGKAAEALKVFDDVLGHELEARAARCSG